jgi:DNA-binding response OmpR family regulator
VATILLVEDDEDLAFAIKIWFELRKHQVEAVTTGLEAIEQIKFGTFDLIILDGLLPDMEGVEICRNFRAAGGTVPILMLSGNAMETHKDSGLEAGANDYLAKPFAIEELTSRMESLLAKAGTK